MGSEIKKAGGFLKMGSWPIRNVKIVIYGVLPQIILNGMKKRTYGSKKPQS